MNNTNNILQEFLNLLKEQLTLMSIPVESIIFSLLISFVEGLVIYIVYKKTYQGVIYVKSFNVSLVVLTMITSMIISAISSNLVLSFGMVGALSIIRFRTAIKDPLDTVFMFWAISTGLVNGGGFYTLGILGTLIISIVLILMMRIHKFSTPYLLIVSYRDIESEDRINEFMKKHFKKYRVRSKIFNERNEITYEIRLTDVKVINEPKKIEGIENVTLISYSGDYVETI